MIDAILTLGGRFGERIGAMRQDGGRRAFEADVVQHRCKRAIIFEITSDDRNLDAIVPPSLSALRKPIDARR
jgi:hypothetical protein